MIGNCFENINRSHTQHEQTQFRAKQISLQYSQFLTHIQHTRSIHFSAKILDW